MMLNSRVAKWILVVLALLPVVLYIYLGHFSRMTMDDYNFISHSMELGPWQNMLYFREVWTGHYTAPLLFGLLAPIDTALPAVLIVLSALIWTLALTWLIAQFMSLFNVKRHKLEIAVSLAALSVAAGISAFYSRQSFFWLVANVGYTLPLPLLTAILAYTLASATRSLSVPDLARSALIIALCCFVTAGLSELFLVFQLAFMSLLLTVASLLSAPEKRWKVFALLGGGWLGTLASLAVQWTSPGRLLRTAVLVDERQFRPIRSLLDLVSVTLRDLYHLVTDVDTLVGFLLLFAAGMLLSLGYRVALSSEATAVLGLLRRRKLPYFLALCGQFVFIPILWSHTSNQMQFFGRFSTSFMAVVALNGAMIAVCFLAIWRFDALIVFLQAKPKRLPAYIIIVLIAGFALLGTPQLRAMHIFAVNYMFVTALTLLLVAWWEWTSSVRPPMPRQLCLFALASTLIALLSVAALIAVPRYFVGGGSFSGGSRNMSAAAFVLVSLGLIWGAAIGLNFGKAGKVTRVRIRAVCALILCITYASIVIGQIRLIPDFARFASEWDERHALLLELKDSGRTHVSIPPAAFDLVRFLLDGVIVADSGYFVADNADDPIAGYHPLRDYYGLESIVVGDDK